MPPYIFGFWYFVFGTLQGPGQRSPSKGFKVHGQQCCQLLQSFMATEDQANTQVVLQTNLPSHLSNLVPTMKLVTSPRPEELDKAFADHFELLELDLGCLSFVLNTQSYSNWKRSSEREQSSGRDWTSSRLNGRFASLWDSMHSLNSGTSFTRRAKRPKT